MKNNLRELRVQKGWTQADMGARLGISRQSIIAIETEKFDPSLPLAFAIARLFDARIEDIFGEDGKTTAPAPRVARRKEPDTEAGGGFFEIPTHML